MAEGRREFYFQWHLSDRCNLRCKHCYEDGRVSFELDLIDKLKVIDIIINALQKWRMIGRVSLTGGEPLLLDELFPIFKELEKHKEIGQINILTNGTLITSDLAKRLKEFTKLKEVQVSLDGAIQTTHELIRGYGSYTSALQGIDHLLEHGIAVTIMFTLWKDNMSDIPALVDLAIEKKITALTVERVVPCGNGQQLRDKLLSPYELRDVYKYLNESAARLDFKQSGVRLRRSRPLWIGTCNDIEEADSHGIGGFCPIGLSSLAILPDGTVLPCRRLEIPIGNLLRDGLYKIWYDSDLLWRVRDKNNLSGKCKGCKNIPYCGGCRAIAYQLTGDYMGEDSQCWI